MQTLSPQLRIGVLRGGPSSEYDVSLKTGAHVLAELSETHRPIDIFISKDGTWHMQGIPRTPERILKHVDVVFNALHGQYGEDGLVQALLNHYGVLYTGTGKYESAIAMNKYLTKEHLVDSGIKTPIYGIIRDNEDVESRVRDVHNTLPLPVVVKPVKGGSSIGVVIARTPEALLTAIQNGVAQDGSVLVEEYIPGREATCGVVNSFRGKSTYALPPVEIITHETKDFFDYEAKYNGSSREICPSTFTDEIKKEIEDLATKVHDLLRLRHYSRSDFIVHPKRGVYFLEVNTLPGLTSESLLPKSLQAVGTTDREFIHHVIGLALGKN